MHLHLSPLEIPVSSLEIPMSALEIPMSSLGIPMGSLEIPMSPLEIPVSALEIPMSALEIPMSSLGIPRSALEIPRSFQKKNLRAYPSKRGGFDKNTLIYPTKLIIFPGTIITLLGVFPSNCLMVLSSFMTISSICAAVKSKGKFKVKRIFPLKETGYSLLLSTKYSGLNLGNGAVEILI